MHKIVHADWSLNRPRLYDVRPTETIHYSRPVSFGRENLQADFNESQGELSIYNEKLLVVNCTGTLLLLLFKANCIKVQ